jgi:hypothetical protein
MLAFLENHTCLKKIIKHKCSSFFCPNIGNKEKTLVTMSFVANVMKLFSLLKRQKAKGFVLGMYFNHILVFASKAAAYLIEAPCACLLPWKASGLSVKIIPSWKNFPRTNALAYFVGTLVTKKKKFSNTVTRGGSKGERFANTKHLFEPTV